MTQLEERINAMNNALRPMRIFVNTAKFHDSKTLYRFYEGTPGSSRRHILTALTQTEAWCFIEGCRHVYNLNGMATQKPTGGEHDNADIQ